MQPRTFLLALLVLLTLVERGSPQRPDNGESMTFLARGADGKTVRGQLSKLSNESVTLGKKTIPLSLLLSLRREGVPLPPLPSEQHLLLANGDRVPCEGLRLAKEKLLFTHRDFTDKDVAMPLGSVVMIWRVGPNRTVSPEKFRRRFASGKRDRDTVLLANGDTVVGTLNAINAQGAEVEVNKKTARPHWSQIAAIALNTELLDKAQPKDVHVRVAIRPTEAAPGGRFTLTEVSSDGKTLVGKTVFAAPIRVPLARVAGLEVLGGAAVELSSLVPKKYEYRPFLDEKFEWATDANVLGRDLRVGESSHDRGIGMHAHSTLTFALEGYSRFEAVVGLDEVDGRRGRVRVGVLVDGKAADLGKNTTLTRSGPPMRVSVDVKGAKELTLEVVPLDNGPVQGVVNWVETRLVK